MEVISAAGSVAGLASLAGQAVQSILKICDFLKDIKHASADIHHLLRDLGHLLRVLEQVKSMEKFEYEHQSFTLWSLKAMINECINDLNSWLAWIRKLTPGSSRHPKTWIRRFRSVGNKGRLAVVRDQVVSHRGNIALGLTLLGRHYDVSHSRKLDIIQRSLTRLEGPPGLIDGLSPTAPEPSFVGKPTLGYSVTKLAGIIRVINTSVLVTVEANGCVFKPVAQRDLAYDNASPETRTSMFQQVLVLRLLQTSTKKYGQSCIALRYQPGPQAAKLGEVKSATHLTLEPFATGSSPMPICQGTPYSFALESELLMAYFASLRERFWQYSRLDESSLDVSGKAISEAIRLARRSRALQDWAYVVKISRLSSDMARVAAQPFSGFYDALLAIYQSQGRVPYDNEQEARGFNLLLETMPWRLTELCFTLPPHFQGLHFRLLATSYTSWYWGRGF